MANIGFDHFNKYILHDETDTLIQVQEIYDKAKDEEDFPSIAMTTDVIVTATGKDSLGGGEFTGITMVLENGWTLKSRTSPGSATLIKIAGGNTIAASGDRITLVANINYEVAQSTSPAAIVTGGVSPTQNEIRDAMTLNTVQAIADGSIDAKLDDLLILTENDQEWITPGLLKVYDGNGKVGGVTIFEFETRDSSGVQTFTIADVKQFIKTKG